MAQKMKTTLTWLAQEKLKRENVRRAKSMKEKKVTREWKEDRGKTVKENKEWKGEEVVKWMRRGLKALKEIRRYQSGTELLIWRLPFQRVVK